MSDPSSRPSVPAAGEKLSDTRNQSVEATGAASPSGEADRTTTAGRPTGDSTTDALPQLGEYRVVAKIGEGGMGSVFVAEDARLGRKAALKTMRPELAADRSNRDRFFREARAAAAVEHDFIVPIWQVGEAPDGTPFIAMPFLQGEPLDARLKREPVAPLALVLKVAREVSEGLAAAHAKGLIHRDIKPANIWLEGDPTAPELGKQIRRCKILDFGLARSLDKDDAHLTASGMILGTPAYMAPEQARGEKVDHRADLWSLGVTLYRAATGRMPFGGTNAMSVMCAVLTDAPRPVRELAPDLPPALGALIDQLMSKDAAARPQSATEVSAVIRQLIREFQAKRAAPAPAVRVEELPSAVEVSGSAPRVLPVASDELTARSEWESATSAEPAELEEDTDEDEPVARPQRAGPRTALLVAVGLLLVGLVGLVGWGVYTLTLSTPEGTLVVEINDPEIEARFKNGKLVLTGPGGKEYTLAPAERNKKLDAGAYMIRVEGADGLVLNTNEFTLKKDGKFTVRVTLAPPVVAKKPDTTKPGSEKVPVAVRDDDTAEFLDSTNWEGNVHIWKLADGAIIGETKVDPKVNTCLCSKKKYTDFELSFRVRLQDGFGNSGVQIRSELFDAAQFRVRGPQVDIGKGFWGSLYGEATGAALMKAADATKLKVKESEFNDFHITVRGSRVVIRVNGETVVDGEFKMSATGIIAFQAHGGYPGMRVEFRDIKFKDLSAKPAGAGFAPLFNGTDLTGWAKDGAAAWRVEGGALVTDGKDGAAGGFLLVAREYADFRLRCEYRLAPGAKSGIAFRARAGERIKSFPYHPKVQLIDGQPKTPTGSVLWANDAATYRAADRAPAKQPADEWNKLEVEMIGSKLRVTVNGEEVTRCDLSEYAGNPLAQPGTGRARGQVGLQSHTGAVAFRNVEIEDLSPGWEALFNGKDLTGWTTRLGGPSNWKVADGAITCTGPQDHLYTTRNDYGDFHLVAEVKINAQGNSGIYFRAGKPLTLVGDYEAQICVRPDQQRTGSLYNLEKFNDNLVAADTWFTYEVIAEGDRIRLRVNGKETANCTEKSADRRRDGYIALQHHDPGTSVHFRRFDVRRLGAGRQRGAAVRVACLGEPRPQGSGICE